MQFRPCDGCDGNECIAECQYPGVQKEDRALYDRLKEYDRKFLTEKFQAPDTGHSEGQSIATESEPGSAAAPPITEDTMNYLVKIEDGNVKVYNSAGGLCSDLGTLRPDDGQIVRVIHRAIDFGRNDKAREIREVIGAR